MIGGAQYPVEFPWAANIYFVRHLPPGEHPGFYSSSRLTLNTTRAAMARMGYCPSGRLFEAAACGTPILTDAWEGLDVFFRPESEILVAHETDDVILALEASDAELERVALGPGSGRSKSTPRSGARRSLSVRSRKPRAGVPSHSERSPAPWSRERRDVGIVPAAGSGTRIQPLAFSKELLPVGSRRENGTERPRAVSEYLVERMTRAGADRICFVISPTKSDILRYYGSRFGPAHMVYAVQQEPRGLCDAIFRAIPLIAPSETVVIGLPDTIWFPEDGLRVLPDDRLACLLFPWTIPSCSMRWSPRPTGGSSRFRSNSRTQVRSGSGAPSSCLAGSSTICTGCGASGISRTSISARCSMHISDVAEMLTASAPARRMSMSAR